jgi:hypothetical protein
MDIASTPSDKMYKFQGVSGVDTHLRVPLPPENFSIMLNNDQSRPQLQRKKESFNREIIRDLPIFSIQSDPHG